MHHGWLLAAFTRTVSPSPSPIRANLAFEQINLFNMRKFVRESRQAAQKRHDISRNDDDGDSNDEESSSSRRGIEIINLQPTQHNSNNTVNVVVVLVHL